jgi:hypothetical protein
MWIVLGVRGKQGFLKEERRRDGQRRHCDGSHREWGDTLSRWRKKPQAKDHRWL